MSLNIGDLVSKMLESFKTTLSEHWSVIKDYAETEARKLAENFLLIQKLRLTEGLSEEVAKLHHQIQHNATRAVLLTVQGLGLIAVERALNAAMGALRDTVNTALGFELL